MKVPTNYSLKWNSPAVIFVLQECRRMLLILITLVECSFAPSPTGIDYSVHANIIYHLTKYVNWPEYKKNGDFIIGVVGDTPLLEELEKVSKSKTAGHQKIVVKKVSAKQASFDCHILFLGEEEAGSLKKIAARTANSPTLLVCEGAGAASRGAAIDFKVVAERLKLEINKSNIEHHSLSVANELLTLGTLVQ